MFQVLKEPLALVKLNEPVDNWVPDVPFPSYKVHIPDPVTVGLIANLVIIIAPSVVNDCPFVSHESEPAVAGLYSITTAAACSLIDVTQTKTPVQKSIRTRDLHEYESNSLGFMTLTAYGGFLACIPT